MPKKFNSQSRYNRDEGGALPILILLAALGLLGFLLISNTFDFRDNLFSRLFPKPPSEAARPEAPSVPDEILLKFKPGVSEKARENVMKRYGLNQKDSIPQIDVIVAKVAERAKTKVINALQHNPRIEYAEPNSIAQVQDIPNDTYYAGRQWNLRMIGAPAAWDITKGDSSVVVGVVDTGLYEGNNDLAGRFVPGASFVGYTTSTDDDYAHGTRVSGIISAIFNNAKGVAGLVPLSPVMPLKACSLKGECSHSDLSNAIIYAANQGIKIINLSFGSRDPSTSLQDAINYAWGRGAVVAASVGNDGTFGIYYPAAGENVIAVGATDFGDAKTAQSNFGPSLDVVAPGSGIYTTDRGAESYGGVSGTSYATAHVSALAALILSANPGLTNQQVADIITSTALDLGDPGWDQYYGYGRIQADKALQKAINTTPQPVPTPTPTPAPIASPTPTPSDSISPTTFIISPTQGQEVLGTITIVADAFDNLAISSVSFFLDNAFLGENTTASYTMDWNTQVETNGFHALKTIAVDTSGNIGESAIITVNVNNPNLLTPFPTPIPTSAPSTNSVIISNISSTTTANSATISWTTNIQSTSKVSYGLTTALGSSTVEDTQLVTSHQITITGLTKATKYYYKIFSKTEAGLETSSGIQQFRTKNK